MQPSAPRHRAQPPPLPPEDCGEPLFNDLLRGIADDLERLRSAVALLSRRHEAEVAAAGCGAGRKATVPRIPEAELNAIVMDERKLPAEARPRQQPGPAPEAAPGAGSYPLGRVTEMPCQHTLDPALCRGNLDQEEAPSVRRSAAGKRCAADEARPEFHMGRSSALSSEAVCCRVGLLEAWTAIDAEDVERAHRAFKLAAEQHRPRKAPTAVGIFEQGTLALGHQHTRDHLAPTLSEIKQHARWMMHPQSMQRIMWDVTSIGFIIYDILTVPLQAFEPLGPGVLAWLDAMEWACAIFWTIDVLMSFRTGYFVGARLEMSPLRAAQHYAKTWFVLDVCLVVPEWVARVTYFADGFQSGRVTRMVRIARIIRMGRLVKVGNFFNRLEDSVRSNFWLVCFSMIKMSAILSLCVHLLSCCWYAIGASATDGWVHVEATEDKGFWFKYFAAARWTLAQINGRTDQRDDRNMPERLFTCLCALLTVIFVSMFISSLTTRLMELQALMDKATKYTRLLNSFLDRHKLSWSVAYFATQYLKSQQMLQDEKESECEIMRLLPKQMQNEILFEIRAPVLAKHAFFGILGEDAQLQRVVRHLCNEAVSLLSFRNTEVVFEKGDTCTRMLFIVKGDLKYSQTMSLKKQLMAWAESASPGNQQLVSGWSSSTVAETLRALSFPSMHRKEQALELPGTDVQAGMWLSEAALWSEWKNQGELLAISVSHMLCVEVSDFVRVIKRYKEAHAQASAYSWRFMEELERLREEDVLSDFVSLGFLWKFP